MTDHKMMYHTLFNKVTNVIAELQAAQRQTEEMYINCDEQNIELSLAKNEKQDSVSTISQK